MANLNDHDSTLHFLKVSLRLELDDLREQLTAEVFTHTMWA